MKERSDRKVSRRPTLLRGIDCFSNNQHHSMMWMMKEGVFFLTAAPARAFKDTKINKILGPELRDRSFIKK